VLILLAICANLGQLIARGRPVHEIRPTS